MNMENGNNLGEEEIQNGEVIEAEFSKSCEHLTENEQTERNIINNYSQLCEHLTNVPQFLVHMVENRIFSFHEMEDIKKYPTSLERNSAIFDLLLKKDWESIQHVVIEIFRKTNNDHVAAIINGVKMSPQKMLATSNKRIAPIIAISCALLLAAICGAMLYWNLRPKEQILKEKWWPRKMNLVNSFYERKLNGTDIILVEGLHNTLKSVEKDNEFTNQKVVIDGLPGVGKTETAIWFSNYYNNDYDYIIWISCEKESLHFSLMNLARQLSIPAREELDKASLSQQIFAKFSQMKCLWIFDYAEYEDNRISGVIGIKDILFELKYPNFDTIITSVNGFWGRESDYGKIQNFTLSPFSKFESISFLEANLKSREFKPMYKENLERMAEILDNFPLALQIAVNTLNDVPEESLEDFIDNANEILNSTDHLPDYGKTIFTTMKISIDSIKEKDYGGLAYEILTVFGYLRPENIDMMFFGSILQCDIEKDLKEALNLLERRFLIGVNERDTINYPGKQSLGTLSMHRLLQLYMRTFENQTKTEKETLIKILDAKGFVSYKLTPYAEYAVKYDDLKEKFHKIRAELIEQLQLVDYLYSKQFEEAMLLSEVIHTGFTSGNGFQNSAKNYGLCLQKADRLDEALKIFDMLNNALDWDEMNNFCGINLHLKGKMSKLEIALWGVDLLKRVGKTNESELIEKEMIDALNTLPDNLYKIQDYIDPIDLSIFRKVKGLVVSFSEVYIHKNESLQDSVIKDNLYFHSVSFVNEQGGFLKNVNFSQIPFTRTVSLFIYSYDDIHGLKVSNVHIDLSELTENTTNVALVYTDFVCSKVNPHISNLVLAEVGNLKNTSSHLPKLTNLYALKVVSSFLPLPNNYLGFYRIPEFAFFGVTFILPGKSTLSFRNVSNDFVVEILSMYRCSFTDQNGNALLSVNFTDLNVNVKDLIISNYDSELIGDPMTSSVLPLTPSNILVDLSKLTHTQKLSLDSVEIICSQNLSLPNYLQLILWNISNSELDICLPKFTNLYYLYLKNCDSKLDLSKIPNSVSYLHLTNISVQNYSIIRLSVYFLENYGLKNDFQRKQFLNVANGIQSNCTVVIFDYSLCQTENWVNNKSEVIKFIDDQVKIAFGAPGCVKSNLKTVLNLAKYRIGHSSDFYAIENGKGKAINKTELHKFCSITRIPLTTFKEGTTFGQFPVVPFRK